MMLLSCRGYLSSNKRMIIRRNGILLTRRKKGLVYISFIAHFIYGLTD
jgi:hypothetical protein